MIRIDEFAGRNVAVLGLGRTGLAAAKSLIAGGANVIAWDDHQAGRDAALAADIPVSDITRRDLSDLAALVLSPGIAYRFPAPHHVVSLAQACKVPVISDVELFARASNRLPDSQRPKVVGITGTNGKSTTTALITHILQAAHLDAHSGGNIGRACLDLPAFHRGQVHVLELSSYQLETTHSLRCDVAVLLNISPDHLDRHGGMENYVLAKTGIFANQTKADMAVIGVDDDLASAMVLELDEKSSALCAISSRRALGEGVYVSGAKLVDTRGGNASIVADLCQAPGLHGAHNWQNAAAAYVVARHLGVSANNIAKGLYSFAGLAHRMQSLGHKHGILFVNDSKATNAKAAAQALATYPDIYWIAGGQSKDDGLQAALEQMGNVRKAYLIGQAAKTFGQELAGQCDSQNYKTLERAFAAALADARNSSAPEPVILLSPACASFDQFTDFTARGDAFCALVDAL
ncbi:UDP-N-acetylmuramoylalanine--D-glutamate ligase [hydrothermal vent metagenome]|uniref:UDP-N-acetylmuramoylalanine--D-glutamate ligase n=1 Tax=hydrothermal vent metagenome TaxID=652676 RepID=A0A3B0RYL1_9ZZZZ